MGLKGNSAILTPRGSVRRQYLSSPAENQATCIHGSIHFTDLILRTLSSYRLGVGQFYSLIICVLLTKAYG